MTLKVDINNSEAVQAINKLEEAFDKLFDSSKKLSAGIDSVESELPSLKKSSKDVTTQMAILDKGVGELNNGLITSEKFMLKYSKALNDVKKAYKDGYGENKKYEQSLNDVSTSLKLATKRVNALQQENDELNSSFVNMGGVFKTIKAAAVGYITVLGTMALTDFIQNTFQAGIQLDALQRSFVAITGDAGLAAAELQRISEIADDLGLNLSTLERSYKDILAASKNTALEGQNVQRVFLSINKAAAVLGMTTEQTEGALRALSQMISKGNVQAEELRGQLGERLPGAFQLAAEAMNVTTQQLNDMLENGEVLADDLLPRLADVLEDRYGQAAAEASNRVGAGFERLGNAVERLQRLLASDTGVVQGLSSLADKTASLINSAVRSYDNMTKLQRDVAAVSASTINATLSDVEELNERLDSLIERASKPTFGATDDDIAALIEMQIRLNDVKDTVSDIQSLRQAERTFGFKLTDEMIKAQRQEEILIALEKLRYDNLRKQQEKALVSTNKQYNELITMARKNNLDTTQIETEKQQSITRINQEYADKRAKLAAQEQAKQLAPLKKQLTSSIQEGVKAQNALNRLERSSLPLTEEKVQIQQQLQSIVKEGLEAEERYFNVFNEEANGARTAADGLIASLKKIESQQKQIGKVVTFEDAVQDLKRQAEELSLTNDQREIQNELLKIERKIKQDLIGEDEALIKSLIETNIALERQRGLFESIKSPIDNYKEVIGDLEVLFQKGKISIEEYTNAVNQLSLVQGLQNLNMELGTPEGTPERAYEEELVALEENYNQRLLLLQQLREAELVTETEYKEKLQQLNENYNQNVLSAETQLNAMRVSLAADSFSSLAQVMKVFAGEQSGLYKSMFIASKAFAIADASLQIWDGIAKAANNPWPTNLAAMASVAAQTANIVGNIQAISLNGFQNGGEFKVGGSGGPDSQLVQFMASPTETVSVRTPAQQDRVERSQASSEQSQQTQPPGVTVVNVVDKNMFGEFMSSIDGDTVIMNSIQSNSSQIAEIVRNKL